MSRWPSSRAWRSGCAVAVCALAGGTLALGQQSDQDGPVVLGENAGKWQAFYLQSFQTQMVMNGTWITNRLETVGQQTVKQSTTDWNLSGLVNFDAFVGHKNLMEITGSLQLGYEYLSQDTNLGGPGESSGAVFDQYNLQALILQESNTPITVYGLQDQTRQNREFASTLTQTTSEYGAIVELKSSVVPLKVQYFHRDISLEEALSIDDQRTVQDTVSLIGNSLINDSQRLEYYYTFDHVQDTQGVAFRNDFDRQDASVVHNVDFGSDKQHNLRSSLHYYDETGLYAQRRLRLDEQLVLHHTERLETHYNLSLQDQQYAGQDQRTAFGTASLRHKLFESLVSNLTAGASKIDVVDQFTSTSKFASAVFDYTKVVPFGRLDASAGGSYNQTDNSARGGAVTVFDEPHTFTDPFGIVLPRRNIVPGSVRVTDLAHFPYVNGVDFTVDYFPDRAEVHRLPFGSIANGQTVLVTYTVGPEPANTFTTTSGTLSLRYTLTEGPLNGLAFYTTWIKTNQSVDAVDPSLFVLDDVTDWRYGIDYRRENFTLQLEFQDYDSTISPFDQLHFLARWDTRYSRFAALALEFTYDDVDYTLTGNHVNLMRAISRWTQQLDNGLNLMAYLQYRDEDSTLNGAVRGFEWELSLNWQLRQVNMYATYHSTMLNGPLQDGLSQSVMFGFTRTF